MIQTDKKTEEEVFRQVFQDRSDVTIIKKTIIILQVFDSSLYKVIYVGMAGLFNNHPLGLLNLSV